MKYFIIFLLILVLALGGGAWYLYSNRVELVQTRFEHGLESLLGNDIGIQEIRVERAPDAPFPAFVIEIEKLKVKNPPGFKIPNMALVYNIRILFDPIALIQGKWHIQKASAYLSKTEFEYNTEGRLNIENVPALMIAPGQIPPASDKFFIGQLEIMLGTLYYLDFRPVLPALPERIKRNYERQVQVFSEVTDPAVFVQAPVLHMISDLNKGSLGLPRGRMQENIASHIKT